MRNRFVISESDRQSILSMYGLLNEDENKTRIVGTIQVVPTYFRAQNIELSLYGNNQDDSYEPIDGLDIEDMVLLGKTKTNNNGDYVFNNVTDFDNLFISFEGNDFYDSINYRVVKLTPNKDNTVDFNIKSKNGKKPDDEEKKKKPKKIKKCEKKESDNNKFYGYGEYMIDGDTEEIIKGEPFKKNVQGKMYQEASKVAVKDALFDYLDLYPNKLVSFDTLYKHILNIIGTQDLKKLTITCKKVFYQDGKIVATTIVKFKKTFLDQEIKKLEPKTVPVVRKIDFEDIDFQKALENSFTNKKKIFLFFCADNEECNNLLKNFVELGDLDKKLDGWIKLYYKVDMSQEKKYVVASETLKVFTYPTVVILEASKDPTKNYIKDSVRIIKKITSFDETISGMSNLLN